MPRSSYSPKNRYIYNAMISEEDTETLVWLYVQGFMAAGVAEFYQAEFGDTRTPPSTKTINKLYGMLGRYLFERLLETRLPPSELSKADNPVQYDSYLEKMAETLVEFSLSKLTYETWRNLRGGNVIYSVDDQIPAEIRRIYSARKGLSNDPRAVIGLAAFRRSLRQRYSSAMSEEYLPVIMHKALLRLLEFEPLGLPEDKRSERYDPLANTDFKAEGQEEGEKTYGTFAIGLNLSDDAFANLLSLYLQSFDHITALRALSQIMPEEAGNIEVEVAHKLFLTFGRLIFKRQIVPLLPTDDEFRSMFPSDQFQYYHQVASLLAQVSLENPAGRPYHVTFREREVLFLHEDIVAEIRREYFAGDALTIDPQGLVGLSVFRFVYANHLETGWNQPDLLFCIHQVVLNWLKRDRLDMMD